MSDKQKKSHARAPGMTQISISLPKRLVGKVDCLAQNEKRSRSNYITFILENIPDIAKEVQYLKAAEPKEQFTSK